MPAHFRHLMIISGQREAIFAQYSQLTEYIAGDWLVITSEPLSTFSNTVIQPTQAKQLLGREFKHAIFDATQGFNLDAFAILSGALVADSILILLLPEHLADWHDQDSLRWNEQTNPITVPNFITHLTRVIQQSTINQPKYVLFNKINELQFSGYLVDLFKEKNGNFEFKYNQQQHDVLNKILISAAKIILLTAKRGRGKSALAGLFSRHYQCWVTAPNKNSINTLVKFAEHNVTFFAPDELILKLDNSSERPEYLIIDEAAMIPLPIIERLLDEPYRVLLTTTIDGYEGTGQGLLLKLFARHQQQCHVEYYHLSTPIRWPNNDPLEQFVDDLTVASNVSNPVMVSIINDLKITQITQHQLINQQRYLTQFWQLLKTAHYRTSLIDLRRLLDAQKLSLWIAESNNNIIGGLITIQEGELSSALATEVLHGYRRPKGNLVAQSLVAHAGDIQAAMLRSIRVNRIAVEESIRCQGVATQLIKQLLDDIQSLNCDFVSVSYAYSKQMYRFWTKLGFTLVHIGSHKEASSGCYAAMAIYPLSNAGNALKQRLSHRLQRNWPWLATNINIELEITNKAPQILNQDDYTELNCFADTAYAYSAAVAVLRRFAHNINSLEKNKFAIKHSPLGLLMIDNLSEQQAVQQLKLSGKKELLIMLRQQVKQLLSQIEANHE